MGENVTKASKIGGLGQIPEILNKSENDSEKNIIDLPNCELAHIGFGMGCAIGGTSCYVMVKQLDFIILALDHFLNTRNQLFHSNTIHDSDCTVVSFMVDLDNQGPQSSFCGALEIFPSNFEEIYFPIFENEFEFCFSEKATANLKLVLMPQSVFKIPLPELEIRESKSEGFTKIQCGAQDNLEIAFVSYGITAADISINLESTNGVLFNLFAPRKLALSSLSTALQKFDSVIFVDFSGSSDFIWSLAAKLIKINPDLHTKIKVETYNEQYSGVGKRLRFKDIYG
jgi:hypothetical protein